MKRKGRGGQIFVGVFIVATIGILLISLNLNPPATVQQQTTFSNTGSSSTVTIKTCDTSPLVLAQSCANSNNIVKSNTTLNSVNCTTGIAVNGVCPSITVPLSTNPLNNNTMNQPPPTPAAETIQVIPNVLAYNSFGSQFTVQSSPISLPLGNVLTFGANNDDIYNGKITMALQIKASPHENINANGIMWVSVNSVNLHPQGVSWTASGTTDSAGLLTASLEIPTGTTNLYSLSLISPVPNFPQTGLNLINFTLSNVNVKNQAGQSYQNKNMQNFFSMSLNYDTNKVIQTDASGKNVVVYPSDDTLFATGITATSPTTVMWCGTNPPTAPTSQGCPYSTVQTVQIVYSSPNTCIQAGGTWVSPSSCVWGGRPAPTQTIGSTGYTTPNTPHVVNTVIGAPDINLVSAYLENSDGTETVIGSTTRDVNGHQVAGGLSGGVCIVGGSGSACTVTVYVPFNPVQNIPRNSDVRIHVEGTMPVFDQRIHTDVVQKSYDVQCDINSCKIQ